MVFEQLYSARWIEKKGMYAFLLGFSYSIIGIASAMFIFPSGPGLPAVAFISLLILPSLNKLLSLEENKIAGEKKAGLTRALKDHIDIIKVYALIFFGIFVAFAFFSLFWPQMATEAVFKQQARILGRAAAHGEFVSMLLNNFKVLLFCLIFSFGYGAGSILLLTWNASVWGTLFALIAKNSAIVTNQNPIIYFLLIVLAVTPHMVLEAGSYFLAAVSGGIVSKATVREKFMSKRFKRIIKDSLYISLIALIVLVIAAFVEAYVLDTLMYILGL